MYSCDILFPAHHQITIIKNPSAAEGRHNHTFFELDCIKVGRCLAELGGDSFFLPADSFAFLMFLSSCFLFLLTTIFSANFFCSLSLLRKALTA